MRGNRKDNSTLVRALVLALVLTMGLALAQGLAPEPAGSQPEDPAPREPVSVEATVQSAFTYQGMLRENGSPVNGNRDMTFRLYLNSTCTGAVPGIITKPGVPVANGLFSVELGFSHGHFNGQAL